MAKPEFIARQSRQPSGWLDEIVARVMAVETAHANRIAVARLAVRAGESTLEVGCGHGQTLARIARGPCGFLAGIDPSEVMFRRVLRPGGRALLGYRPRDTETLAALPRTVYVLRSVDETEGLLAEAGFTAIRSTEHSIARSPFVCTEARS